MARQDRIGRDGLRAFGGAGVRPRIVDALAAHLPRVTFIPMEMMSCEIVEALRSGRLDFGLTRFDDVPFVGYSKERGGFLREVQARLFAAFGIAPQIRLEVSQTQTILALVNRGIGLALVPRSSAAMQMPNLVFREIDLPERFRSDLYLATALKRSASVMHRRVMEVIWKELKAPAVQARFNPDPLPVGACFIVRPYSAGAAVAASPMYRLGPWLGTDASRASMETTLILVTPSAAGLRERHKAARRGGARCTSTASNRGFGAQRTASQPVVDNGERDVANIPGSGRTEQNRPADAKA
jgi:hypothetical protein